MAFFTKNIGFEDKVIRILLAVLFFLLGIKYSKWFFLLSAFMFLEAVFSRCALYAILKINTSDGHFSCCTSKKEVMPKKTKKKSRR